MVGDVVLVRRFLGMTQRKRSSAVVLSLSRVAGTAVAVVEVLIEGRERVFYLDELEPLG